ncbi:hypothetical protein P3342_007673 [Pyrenophora teres f. teres]|uniref:Uncharacterized protein n=1 Tax=Pyrenophora teres f. teres TaxID=97479 RepID=A0A6S6W207_9PLEO|nr:hypothetical protein HRS9122_09778 [Pyrenophora teres f. teres]KAE8839404.1 hypothetical protein HRS9139_03787 [Pyrenophora teres f. teres]KAE8845369.1 hypothetical protein PTNB85_03634 [Pyrenophora teres f. teres]KAE8865483.1 hypothetical protein PTNB29_02630 [Pyrenophora teres f. teres]KAE8871123.1 hypothetical protein PTNB73_02582 [Pyrenophora teres f. teres]
MQFPTFALSLLALAISAIAYPQAVAQPEAAELEQRQASCAPQGSKGYCVAHILYEDSKGNIVGNADQNINFDTGGAITFFGPNAPNHACKLTILRNCSGCGGWAIQTRTAECGALSVSFRTP